MNLTPYLDDLESRIDPAVEDALVGDWRRFCDGKHPQPIFRPTRLGAIPSKIQWPAFPLNRALEDIDIMLYEQLRVCSMLLDSTEGKVMMVRANYGTPILVMPFGAELFLMSDESNTLPASHPLGTEGVRRYLENSRPSADHPYLQQIYEFARRYNEIRKRYPKISRYIPTYHPDLQSPMDIVEMLWGSEVFVALLDDSETVHKLLRIVTDLYKEVMQRWIKLSPLEYFGMGVHWHHCHRGRIFLRQDSAMNLSPSMYEEFIKPYDSELLAEFGGGAIHSCGRVDHFVGFLQQMPGLFDFNLSQPHLNDMEVIFRQTIDRGINLVNLRSAAAEAALGRSATPKSCIHTFG